MHKLYRFTTVIICLLFAFSAVSCGFDESEELSLEDMTDLVTADDEALGNSPEKVDITREPVDSDNTIFVHICGQVVKPGVYELSAGSRVYELLQRAEGFTDEACSRYINQAELLSDGQQIYVPSLEEVVTTGEMDSANINFSQSSAQGKSDLININNATKEELITISGIGDSRANDIISYRQEHGRFSKIEDIMQVPGIKEGLFGKIKDKITV